MKAERVAFTEKGIVCVEEYEIGEVNKDDVLVQTLYSAISPGTELAFLHQMENTVKEYPFYPGYSACCKVLKIGENVKKFKVGDTIVCIGQHMSRQVISSDLCTLLPSNVSEKDASVYCLASIALQGVRKAKIQIGDEVAVIGLGPIGNFAAQIANVAGATVVTGFDFIKWKGQLATQCGVNEVEYTTEKEELQNKFDVVIEATGSPKAILSAFKIAKPFGRVILLGSSRGNTENVNFYEDVHKKGITIVGAHTKCRAKADNFGCIKTLSKDNETIMALLGQRRIRSDLLISEVTTINHAQEVYDRLLKKEEGLMIALFDWTKKKSEIGAFQQGQ